MPRLLVYATPARGHLYPIVPMLVELRRRGHVVAVRTLADEVDRMRGRGSPPRRSRRRSRRALSRTGRRNRRPRCSRWPPGHSSRVRSTRCPTCVPRSRRRRPTFCSSTSTPGAPRRPRRRQGLPWALFSPYCVPLPSRDAPPFGPGLAPMEGPHRLRAAVRAAMVCKAGAERIAAAFSAIKPHLAADAIEALLRG